MSNEKNDGITYSTNCIHIYKQEIPVEIFKKVNFNEKPKIKRKEYYLPTCFLSKNLIDNIYAKQKNSAKFQSKTEITQDFLICKHNTINFLMDQASTFISIPLNNSIWMVFFYLVEILDLNLKLVVKVHHFWFINKIYSPILKVFAVLVLYMIQRIVFYIIKTSVNFILEFNKKLESGSIKFIIS